MKPHKHAELIKAWADGAEIEVKNEDGTWDPIKPLWHPNNVYRIKPEEKKPVVRWLWAVHHPGGWRQMTYFRSIDEMQKSIAESVTPIVVKRLEYTRTEFEE